MKKKAQRVPNCHPDKPYAARGLCRTCYVRAKRDGTLEQIPKVALTVREITRPTCHPDRKHWARGLCKKCYMDQWRADPGHATQRRLTLAAWKQAHPDVVNRQRTESARRHPERRRDLAKKHYERDPDAYWARNLKVKYGITIEQFDAMAAAQDNACAICKRPNESQRRRLDVDHSHISTSIRGLLCENCNRALGLMQDSPELLRMAASYLEERTN